MAWVYHYTVEDGNSPVYTNKSRLVSDIKYDVGEWESGRWLLALAATRDYFKSGGFRNRRWVAGKTSIRVTIWLDNAKHYSYNVDCDDVPNYGRVNVLA
jgi:hypothetical protein